MRFSEIGVKQHDVFALRRVIMRYALLENSRALFNLIKTRGYLSTNKSQRMIFNSFNNYHYN